MRSTPYLSLTAATAMLALSTACRADGFSAGVGTDYSSGKYGGTEATTITSIPFYAKYTSGPLTLKAYLPWLQVTGPGNVIPSGIGGLRGPGGAAGGGGSGGSVGAFGCPADTRGGASKPEDNGPCAAAPAAGGSGTIATATRKTEQGLGDIVVGATYNAIDANGLLLDVTGRVKFATASEERGLGSGKTDYALQLESEKSIDRGFINGGLGYKWLGDPTGVSLRNVWYGGVGGGVKFTPDTTAGVSFDYASAANAGGQPAKELSLYVSQRMSQTLKLNASIFKGLSDGSADWGAGVGLSYAF